MARFQTNPWDLDQLLALMDGRKIVLPEFQRSFVWRPADIDLLITSLVQDFPAGSLLFLRSDSSHELAWRPAEGVEGNGAVTPDYLVLDGQQRLTSLSQGLNGRGDHLFFMDMAKLEAGDIENGIYPLRRTQARQQGLLERRKQWEQHIYPVAAAMGENCDEYWFADYIDFHVDAGADRVEVRDRAREFERRFVKPLKEYRFPVVELPPDTSLEAVCQIFETLNKTGMKLTVFDLLTAKFWPQGLNLREMLEEARREHPLLGEDGFDLDATYLLQSVSLLRSGLCKRGDLLNLERPNFEADWARVCNAASAALGMLRGDCGVLVSNWLPYGALFPSLFALGTKVLEMKGPEAGAGWEKLKRWFWCSCFSQRYDGPANTLNAQDLRQVSAWLTDDDAVPEAISDFSLSQVDLRRVERQRNAIYRAVICLTVVNGARDFHTGKRLTADFLNDPARRIEDHHIFPTAYLAGLQPPREGENSILNRCLIDHLTNKVISKKAPSVYLNEVEQTLGAERLEDVLASHLIPSSGLGAVQDDNLDTFFDAREKLLLRAIAGVTGAPLPAGETDGQVYLDPLRPFTNELALRGVIRGLHGRLFWYEQHHSRKVLEPLAEEINRDHVREIRLLSGPANINEKTQRAFERFAEEMENAGIECQWRVLPASVGRELHARVLFDDSHCWELPPLNSLLAGTVDSIHPSQMPRTPFEDAWTNPGAAPLGEFKPVEAPAEAVPLEVKQNVDARGSDPKTVVPPVADQAEKPDIQETDGASLASPDVEWDYYESHLEPGKLAVLRAVYAAMEGAINARGLDWSPYLRSNYLGFGRPGIYFCSGIGIYRGRSLEFWIKLPLSPDELRELGHDLQNPYPQLEESWHPSVKEWHWAVPAVEDVPDLGPAIEMTARYQPAKGAMSIPTS